MSRSGRIARKLDRYDDVRTMLVAMKNIALMEIHKLSGQIERHNRLLETVALVAADFSASFPMPMETRLNICIVIGAERGFCGEFNTELIAPLRAAQVQGAEILIVGTRLGQKLSEEGGVATISGATMIEEVPVILEQVAAWLDQEQSKIQGKQQQGQLMSVQILYQDEQAGGPVLKHILPVTMESNSQKDSLVIKEAYGNKPHLTLEQNAFRISFEQQSLLLLLEGYFTFSLAAENRKRLDHMDNALHRLDETTDALKQRMNSARQEDIIQEIETIMLGSNGF